MAIIGLLLTLSFFGCQPPEVPTAGPPVSAPASYLFSGNPGIPTDYQHDLTGRVTGTINGVSVNVGPDQPVSADVMTSYYTNADRGPGGINIRADNVKYSVSVAVNAPFRVGDYKVVNNGFEFDEPGTAFIKLVLPPRSAPAISEALPLSARQVRITAITPDWVEGEIRFTVDGANVGPERLAFRLKNNLAENSRLQNRAVGEPFWDYNQTERSIRTDLIPDDGTDPVFNEWFYPATGTEINLLQKLTTPVSLMTYDGLTLGAPVQTVALRQGRTANPRPRLSVGLLRNDASGLIFTRVDLRFAAFAGVGTYTDAAVRLVFSAGSTSTSWWRIDTGLKTNPDTRWRVDVTRVTPDLIEGTYSAQNAPFSQATANFPTTTTKIFSGTFKVIYPR